MSTQHMLTVRELVRLSRSTEKRSYKELTKLQKPLICTHWLQKTIGKTGTRVKLSQEVLLLGQLDWVKRFRWQRPVTILSMSWVG